MRFNKTIFVFSLACLTLAPLLPVCASQPADSKNQGRKLSMTLPGLGTAQIRRHACQGTINRRQQVFTHSSFVSPGTNQGQQHHRACPLHRRRSGEQCSVHGSPARSLCQWRHERCQSLCSDDCRLHQTMDRCHHRHAQAARLIAKRSSARSPPPQPLPVISFTTRPAAASKVSSSASS